MSIERAHNLLKGASFQGGYTGVRICATHTPPPVYCFMEVGTRPKTYMDAVVVEVMTGIVREVYGVGVIVNGRIHSKSIH